MTRETFFELLRWTTGSFHFSAQKVRTRTPDARGSPAEQILMDGLRMIDEWRTFDPEATRADAVFKSAAAASRCTGARCAASRRERSPTRSASSISLDGAAPVRRVIDLSRLGSFEGARILTALRRAGAIEPIAGGLGAEGEARELTRARRARARPTPLWRRAPAAAIPFAVLVVVAWLAHRGAGARAAAASLGDPLVAARAASEALRVRNAAEAFRFARGPLARRPRRADARGRRSARWRRGEASPYLFRGAATATRRRPRSRVLTERARGGAPDIPDEASTRQTLVFDDNQTAAALYGERERTLRIVEQELGIEARARGNEVRLVGDEPRGRAPAARCSSSSTAWCAAAARCTPRDVRAAVRMVTQAARRRAATRSTRTCSTAAASRRRITAKNLSQRRYIELMREHDIVFAVGPAGTGKTYLAMAMAIAALKRHEVSRVILTRPAVEAGEKLGFLPGTLAEKVNPYLRPLYDALHDMMDYEKAARWIERGVIEVAPLAFMRGRTLNDSFVILDEAQNTTPEQMKMFLTRLGFDSKAVVTGDVTQIDLPPGKRSGLIEALRDPATASRASASCASPSPTSCAIRSCSRSSAPTSATRREPLARRAEPKLPPTNDRATLGPARGGPTAPASTAACCAAARARVLAALDRRGAELSIALVDDAEIAELNERYRGKRGADRRALVLAARGRARASGAARCSATS